MGLYDVFETDSDLEQKGIWVDYGDFKIRLASAGQGNPKYVKYAEKALKPIRKALDAGAVDNKRSQAILADIYAKTVILDWVTFDKEADEWKTGIEMKDGSIGEFNYDNVVNTLKALPNLFIDLQEQANSMANFRKAELEGDSGN